MTSEVFGWIGTLLFMVCYIPQIVRAYTTKSFNGISVSMWLIQWAAYTSCLVYAITIQSLPLAFGYSIGWLMTAWYLELYRQHK